MFSLPYCVQARAEVRTAECSHLRKKVKDLEDKVRRAPPTHDQQDIVYRCQKSNASYLRPPASPLERRDAKMMVLSRETLQRAIGRVALVMLMMSIAGTSLLPQGCEIGAAQVNRTGRPPRFG